MAQISHHRYGQSWKIKQHDLFSITHLVLSYFLYIFAHCFTSKLIQIKRKDKAIKKTLIRKMYNPGLEFTTPYYRARCSNNFAMEESQFGKSLFPIYRQPIFITNFNTEKTVSRQSELFACLQTLLKHEDFCGKKVETVKTS